MRWAESHYRDPDGEPTHEIVRTQAGRSAPSANCTATRPAAEFGPKALAAVRQQMIDAGWCRTLINRRIDRVKRVFKWATSQELVPVTVYQSLRTLAGSAEGADRGPRDASR